MLSRALTLAHTHARAHTHTHLHLLPGFCTLQMYDMVALKGTEYFVSWFSRLFAECEEGKVLSHPNFLTPSLSPYPLSLACSPPSSPPISPLSSLR